MGQIKVTVQQANRLKAINNLSAAVKDLARALATNVTVEVNNNTFHGGNPAVEINTEQEVKETLIQNIKDDKST